MVILKYKIDYKNDIKNINTNNYNGTFTRTTNII